MNRSNRFVTLVLALATAAWIGCSKRPAEDPLVKLEREAAEKRAHDHGHDHGHGHDAHGPHDGELIELGDEEYHAELAHDDQTNAVTIYILDDQAKKNVPIEEKSVVLNLVVGGETAQFTLSAKPDEGDSEGKSSRFQLIDAKLFDAVCSTNVKGRLNVTIGGKAYSGAVESHGHDHGHKH